MTPSRRLLFVALAAVPACASAPTDVVVALAPDVVSSLNGTLSVRATVLAEREPSAEEAVDLAIAYTDRAGRTHDVAPVSGVTNDNGVFETTLTGLIWDGSGTVTVTVAGFEGTASFAVLDRTPPVVTITPPPPASVQRGRDLTVQVHVADEIGVSQVYFGSANRGRDRSLVATGEGDVTLDFDYQVPDVAAGTTITLYALGEDLSGNQGAAEPITITVVP